MKKSYEGEIVTHIGPESCGAAREGGAETGRPPPCAGTQPQPSRARGKRLQAVARGHSRYYGVPMNTPALCNFRLYRATADQVLSSVAASCGETLSRRRARS
jgi:hypothetical protein